MKNQLINQNCNIGGLQKTQTWYDKTCLINARYPFTLRPDGITDTHLTWQINTHLRLGIQEYQFCYDPRQWHRAISCQYGQERGAVKLLMPIIHKSHEDREITWPFNGDARLVFHSAHFVKYFIILSVNFEPLCIGPIMSASTVKGNRKREIGQSPIKKRFKDSTISREDLDDAIANGIKLALKEQQSTLDSVVASAVRDAVDSVLIPALRELREDIQATNNSVKELRGELEAIATAAKQTRDQVDSVQAAAREDRRTVTDLRNQLEQLTEKMTDMEDRSRRNNVRLVGLPEGAEGSNAAGFLRVNLSKWIPSLKDRNIEIDRAHHVYDGRKNFDRPCTLIFRVLRWHDR